VVPARWRLFIAWADPLTARALGAASETQHLDFSHPNIFHFKLDNLRTYGMGLPMNQKSMPKAHRTKRATEIRPWPPPAESQRLRTRRSRSRFANSPFSSRKSANHWIKLDLVGFTRTWPVPPRHSPIHLLPQRAPRHSSIPHCAESRQLTPAGRGACTTTSTPLSAEPFGKRAAGSPGKGRAILPSALHHLDSP